MQENFFQRTRRYGSGSRLWIYIFGVLAAIFPLFLLIVLGYLVQLLIDPAGTTLPRDPLLGPILAQGPITWPVELTGQWLVVAAAVTCGIAVLQGLSVNILRRSAHWGARQAAAELKTAIHRQAYRLGYTDVLGGNRSLPEELFTDQLETIRQGLAAWWRSIPYSVTLLVLLVTVALVIHVWLALFALVLAALIWRTDRFIRESAGHQKRLWHERARHLDSLLVESLRLTPLATGYSLDRPPGESFEDTLRQQLHSSYRGDVGEATRSVWLWTMILCGVALVLLVTGLSATATVTGSVVQIAALVSAYFPARRLVRLRLLLPDCERAAKEVFSYLDRTVTVTQLPDARPLEPLSRHLKLENVTLIDRGGKKLLDEVSAIVPAGMRTAIFSSNHHSPVALAGLLVRFYDPVAGRVVYDDVDVRWGTLASIRKRTVLVLNDAQLLTGTVQENITCGRSELSMVQIHDAAKRAHAIEFILDLPDGFETIVGDQGIRLEPSQAFRIALARAVVGDPQLIIIEEPKGLLAPEDGGVLDAALQEVSAGRTTLVIPSRLSTLRSADVILLLHEGKLVAHGKHPELLQSSELYRHLNYLRFNPFSSIR
jgi:ATP-binding cassette, subfamily B, bacterial